MPDVIVTGLPRSGASLVAALIDYLPQSICFNSPVAHSVYARTQSKVLPYCKWLAGDFTFRRAQIWRGESLPDFRAKGGTPLMDGLNDPKQPRDADGKPTPIKFARPKLKGDFILAMKHHTLYTAVLPTLVKFEHFKIIAVIRNPVDVIASWRKLEGLPLDKDNPGGIAEMWPEALQIMESRAEKLDRMVQLYDVFLGRYHELRDKIHMVKYEDVVREPMIISRLFGEKKLPVNAREIQQRVHPRRAHYVEKIQESIKKYGVFVREYYGE